MTTPAQLALVGMSTAEEAASDWTERWEATICRLAAAGGTFSADDVRDLAGEPVDHPNAAGALFMRLARRGVIRKAGYAPSRREVLHHHNIGRWEGTH